jgi:hypothetical protein
VPAAIRRNVELWIGCVAGALEEQDYRAKLARAGFTAIDIEPIRVFTAEETLSAANEMGLDLKASAADIDGKFISAFIRGVKP